jgi:hypothetical protein
LISSSAFERRDNQRPLTLALFNLSPYGLALEDAERHSEEGDFFVAVLTGPSLGKELCSTKSAGCQTEFGAGHAQRQAL